MFDRYRKPAGIVKGVAIAFSAAALAAGALTPASAAPASRPTPPTEHATVAPVAEPSAGIQATPGQCTGSWVSVHAGLGIGVRTAPDATNPNNIMFYLAGTHIRPCRKLVIGGRYGACGQTGANGWILIQDINNTSHPGQPGWSGYIPSTCTSDYS